jgi:predicted ABC-type ATPase
LFLAPKEIKLVNADVIAQAISPENPEIVSYAAANVAEQIRERLLQQGVSFFLKPYFLTFPRSIL